MRLVSIDQPESENPNEETSFETISSTFHKSSKCTKYAVKQQKDHIASTQEQSYR